MRKLRRIETGIRAAVKAVPAAVLCAMLCGGCAMPARVEVVAFSQETGTADAAEMSTECVTEKLPTVETSAETVAAEPETKGLVCVYLCGAVEVPGVYTLESGARLCEALEMAGGFREDAGTDLLNLARVLTDGEMIRIPTAEEAEQARAESAQGADGSQTSDADASGANGLTGGADGSGSSLSGAADGSDTGTAQDSAEAAGRVNLNTATRDELMTLPGIGASKADAIIRYREENGPFASPEDVMNISGIKSAVFTQIRDLVTV